MKATATDNRFTPFCGEGEAFEMQFPAEIDRLHRAVRTLGMLPRTTPRRAFERFVARLFAGLTAKAGQVITDGADLARAIGIEHATRALTPGDVSMEVIDRAPLMYWRSEGETEGDWCIAFRTLARAGQGKHFLARFTPRWDFEDVEFEKDGVKVKRRYRKTLLGLTVTVHHRDGEWGVDPRSEARAYWMRQMPRSAVPSYGGRADYDQSRGIEPDPVE